MQSSQNPFAHLIPNAESASNVPSNATNPFMHLIPKQEESLLNKAGNIAGKFNEAIESSGLPAFSGGLLQSAGDIGTSLSNIPLGVLSKITGKDLTIAHPNLGKYVDNSLPSKAAFGAGEILPYALGGAGAANLVGNLTKNLSNIPLIGKLMARPIEGALAGAAIGENEEGNRGLGAALGAAGNVGLAAGKYAKNLMPEELAKNIVNATKEAIDKYSNIYQGLFNEAKRRGLGQSGLRIPNIDVELIKNHAPKKFTRSLEDFHENPTLETGHLAQSDLGKFTRYLDKVSRNNALSSSQLNAYEEALNAQKKIRGSMFQGLTKQGDQELANLYGKTTKGYARDVIPYTSSKAISAFQNKEIKAPTFAKRIAKDEKFRLAMEHKHPEIAHGEILKNILKGLGLTALGGAGAYGFDVLKDYFTNSSEQ